MQSLTTPPVTSVQPPRTLGRRSPSTSPIILLLGSGRSSHRRPVSTRLPHPLACSARARARPSITTRRPAPPSLLAGCGGGSWLLLRRQNSSELRKHIQRPPSSCAKAVASAAAFLSGQLSVPPPIGFATQLLEDSRSLNFYGCFCHQQHRSLFEARGGGAAYNLARGQEKRSSC
jgi:hypothetical protein